MNNLRTSPTKFLQKPSPLFFHGAFAPSFIWRKRPWTPVEFRGDLWHLKTRVPGLSCGVVCVILRLAVLVELRLVTDRHIHRPMASTVDA